MIRGSKSSKVNLIFAILMLILTGVIYYFATSHGLSGTYAIWFLIVALYFLICFFITKGNEKKEKEANQTYEAENRITPGTKEGEFQARVVKYIYINAMNLPRFQIEITSGTLSTNDKVILPNGDKAKVSKLFFLQGRKATTTAYKGEQVAIELLGIRNNKKLDEGMIITKVEK